MTRDPQSERVTTRRLVRDALHSSSLSEIALPGDCRYVLITKVDHDSLSDRTASFYPSDPAVRAAIQAVPAGWWPDCVIDLEAPADQAVRDAAAADGNLGEAYPFDEDHVVFA